MQSEGMDVKIIQPMFVCKSDEIIFLTQVENDNNKTDI